ncbi:MAG TPA: PE-PPE domain-containing protein [Mycobacterium sp.]|nr:PE-PPE domain-containing protein [Mycobacterium sp.]
MRKIARSILLVVLALFSAVVLGVAAMLTSAGLSLAIVKPVTALIMGGSGTPDPDLEPGYVPNVSSYYIFPNTECDSDDNCTLQAVVTPEEAWPLYGGLTALTWQDSVNAGVEDLDAVVQPRLATLSDTNRLVIFGYSQSGAIASIEKQRLADQLSEEDQQWVEWVVTGNVSRPNGGLNVRLPITLPIVEFPYGPPTPTDTDMLTTDIALKWDIIADAPLYPLNLLAMFNALVGGPGFGINHGTYPNPAGDPPTGLVGGYTQEEWQAIMDNPQGYADANPDVVNVQTFGDTTYITVAPRVLPLLVPLHTIGLGFVADLIEPALRVIVEETGYNRSIPYGQPTPFQLIPIFNPIQLAIDLIAAIPEGINQALNGGRPPLTPPETDTMLTTSTTLSDSVDSLATVDVSKDGTTAPESGSTTSNGGGTTLQKTVVETSSGANATESNGTEVKQVDPTKQDVTKGSDEIKTDSQGTKADPEGTKNDSEGTKKDRGETKQNGSGVSVSLNFSPKKPKDGDTGGTTARHDAAGTTSPEGAESEQAAA